MSGTRTKTGERAARERLLRLERQALARAEAREVAEGVAETVALSRARGQAIAEPETKRKRVCAQPYRRVSGLEWLERKGRIDPAARAVGERYGWAYRRVKLEKAIPSTLDMRARGEFAAPALEVVLTHGERTAAARRMLGEMRGRLLGQADLAAVRSARC